MAAADHNFITWIAPGAPRAAGAVTGGKWRRVRTKSARTIRGIRIPAREDIRHLEKAWQEGRLEVAWSDDAGRHHLIEWRDVQFRPEVREEALLLGTHRPQWPRLREVYVRRRLIAQKLSAPGTDQPQPEPPPLAASAEAPAAPVVAPKGIELPSQEAAPASAADQAPVPAARGGRPVEYDWLGAAIHAGARPHADQGGMRAIMTEGEAQSTPWPADGAPLGEALWRVVDRQAVDREASDRLQRITPEHRASVAEDVALGAAIRQFCDLMQSGRYRATGRRGSPTAEHSEIPRTAWPYLNFVRWRDSLLIESEPSSVVWYDVRVWPMNAEPTTAARPAPERPAPLDPFRTGAAGRPTAIEYIEAEARRRIDQGEVTPVRGGLTKFAKDLEEWWGAKRLEFNPHGPKTSWKAIADKIRAHWNSRCESSKISSEII